MVKKGIIKTNKPTKLGEERMTRTTKQIILRELKIWMDSTPFINEKKILKRFANKLIFELK
jgi:hypothetical protein